jgi:hypothetical protein
MEIVSTLDGFEKYSSLRCSGNSTRIIDHAIQQLFEGKTILVQDIWEEGKNKNVNKDLFDRIIKRINFEHFNIKLKIDKIKLTIKII